QLRLGVEQVEVTGRAGHEQVDDALRLRLEVRLLGRQQAVVLRRRRGGEGVVEQPRQRDLAQADAAAVEEVTPGDLQRQRVHRSSGSRQKRNEPQSHRGHREGKEKKRADHSHSLLYSSVFSVSSVTLWLGLFFFDCTTPARVVTKGSPTSAIRRRCRRTPP